MNESRDPLKDRMKSLPLGGMPRPSVDITAKHRPVRGRDLLTLQPWPIVTRLAHFKVLHWTISAVWRQWKPDESGPAGLCQLCKRCGARDDGCLIIVGRRIEYKDAHLLSTLDFRVQPAE